MPIKDPVKRKLCQQRMNWKHRHKRIAWEKEYRKTHPRKRTEYMRAWWKAHPEKQKEHSEKYRARNALRLQGFKKAYYLRNRERLLEKQRKYYLNNKAKVLAANKARDKANPHWGKKSRAKYAAKNRLKILLRNRKSAIEYYYKNQEACKSKAKFYAHIRRKRIKFIGDVSKRSEIVAFMTSKVNDPNVKCAYCDTGLFGKPIHFDHVIPISKGGRHSVDNLCASCPPCNQSKQAKTPLEFEEYRKLLTN